MVQGNYGALLRQDGSNFYMLLTASGDQYGSWNSLRPMQVALASGDVFFANAAIQLYHSSGYVYSNGFFHTSDARLKENIQTVSPGFSR